MENYSLLFNLSTILLIPLIPAFVLYKFLPSKTVVKGPFKGLNLNLTGAFGGYFLLILITVGLTQFIFNNQLSENLKNSQKTIDSLKNENNKFHQWKMLGDIDSKVPEGTKIFVDEHNISINSLGKFKVSLLVKSDDKSRPNLPDAVCFFNQAEGYSVIDLTEKQHVTIDSTANEIIIKDKIKLSIPSKRAQRSGKLVNNSWD